MKRSLLIPAATAAIVLASASFCFAQTETDGQTTGALIAGIKYIAAAIAVGICAIATGIAQSRIGAAGLGTIVERPETTGTVLICIAIPETMVILGFVVAAMIIIL